MVLLPNFKDEENGAWNIEMPTVRVCGSAEGKGHFLHISDGDASSVRSRVEHFFTWVFHSACCLLSTAGPSFPLCTMYHLLQVHGH